MIMDEKFLSNKQEDTTNLITLNIHHHGAIHEISFLSTATLTDLCQHVQDTLLIPQSSQKYLITPKPGMIKSPFTETQLSTPLTTYTTAKKILLLGSTETQTTALATAISAAHTSLHPRPRTYSLPSATPARTTHDARRQADTQYTFDTLRPLPYLPRPDEALAFLSRLRADMGIRAAMRRWRWRVPLLTEMDPAAHTTHAWDGVSRTLGLNRGGGQVIELRLRTDAGDGYRSYKVIRKTLCHELAHNVWGDHDANFWALCKEIEEVVERESAGRSLGDDELYAPPSSDQSEQSEQQQRSWTGGVHKVGGKQETDHNLTPREMMARAAEERFQREEEEKEGKKKT